MATVEQVIAASLDYFGGDALAASTFATKYALTDNTGNILEMTPDDMFRRIANEFARIEKKHPNPLSEEEIFEELRNFSKIVPQGSPMSGIGNPYQTQSLSNCFVIQSPFDSYGGICRTDEELVQIAKRRGGVGLDISKIRPKGMPTSNAAKTTDGIEVFMERYSRSCREVAQNGRRGALMMTISVHHPQILDFVRIKRNKEKVTGANISVRLTDEFLNAVKNDAEYELRFPVDSKNPTVSKMVKASDIWNEIMESAHGFAEPGLLFWDNIIKNSPADIYADHGFTTISTNPCGEIPLSEYDSCRLMLVNLLSFVRNPFTSEATFDYESFRKTARIAQRLMDDLIDLEIEQVDKIVAKIETDPEPLEVKITEIGLWQKVKKMALLGRRTGLGVTAVGDCVAALGIRYGSDESVAVIEEIYKNLSLSAYRSSCEMAAERGAFPVFSWDREKDHPFISRIVEADPEIGEMLAKHGRRNIALTTTAPAGSVSVMTQTTSGIEPAFLLWYVRRKKINAQDENARVDFVDQSGDRWTEYDVFHHGFSKWMSASGMSKDDVESSPYFKATSNDIDWISKVKVQAAAQRWICHAISNTTNLPNETTVETVKAVYEAGWESGCKGVTVYRDGCRTGVLVSKEEKEEKKSDTNDFVTRHAVRRPDDLACDIYRSTIAGQEWIIIVGVMDGKPYEIMGGHVIDDIPKKIKSGVIAKRRFKTKPSEYDLTYMHPTEGLVTIADIVSKFKNPDHASFTRLLSLSLRHGAPVNYIVEQLLKGDQDANLFSFSKVISRVLKRYIQDGTRPGGQLDCPKCGSTESLIYTEGCVTCKACGDSKC